jgi:hypothetical protein
MTHDPIYCDKQAWQNYSDNELYGEILTEEWFKENGIECTCEGRK